MARATKAATTRRPAAAAEPKKKIGRPLGSKNRVSAAAKVKNVATARKPVSRRVSTAPAQIRMNKAELEAQVAKLERSLARVRTQNAELKQALKEAELPAKAATPLPSASAKTAGKNIGSTPAKRGRRTKAEMAAAEKAQETEADQSGE